MRIHFSAGDHAPTRRGFLQPSSDGGVHDGCQSGQLEGDRVHCQDTAYEDIDPEHATAMVEANAGQRTRIGRVRVFARGREVQAVLGGPHPALGQRRLFQVPRAAHLVSRRTQALSRNRPYPHPCAIRE